MFQNEFQHVLKSGKTNYVKDELKNEQKVGPKMGFKNCLKCYRHLKAFFTTAAFFLIFYGVFFSGLWSSLGVSWAALGFLEGLLGGLWTQKH